MFQRVLVGVPRTSALPLSPPSRRPLSLPPGRLSTQHRFHRQHTQDTKVSQKCFSMCVCVRTGRGSAELQELAQRSRRARQGSGCQQGFRVQFRVVV